MKTKGDLLLVEDDVPLAELVSEFLTFNDYQVTRCTSGISGLKKAKLLNFDLIICDIMLPDISGFELVESLKQSSDTPVIFLTSMHEDDDQLKGLKLGAIDYIIKPVNPRVLLARINNFLYHQRTPNSSILNLEYLSLDKSNHRCELDQQDIHLTHGEFEMLWILVRNIGRPVSREYLFRETVGREYDGIDRTIDARVSRLRKKLESQDINRYTIKSIWGRGYQLCQLL